jgi:polyisoprenyl-teichoic acid--peptidoglycan teichoic acid transferase
MAQNKQSPYRRPKGGSPPKSFDIAAPTKRPATKQSFPEVGMTLSSYSGRQPSKPSSKPTHAGWRSKITRKRVILVILTIVLLIVGWIGFKFVYNAHKLFGGNVFSVLTTQKLKGEDKGRVNILLAGNSADDPGHQGGALTDSIMILSIDTKNNTGFMMSIPRDLYVKVNRGYAKINTVYPTGEDQEFSQSGYADGGMGLLQKTIYQDLGITTHYYALVNYNALRDATDSVGGIDVVINSSHPKGLYDPSRDYSVKGGILVKLANGKQHLTGQQALNLARARGDASGSYGFPNSDFDRTQNQRMIILALRSKATSAGVLTNPIRLGNLFDSVGKNVTTDLELGNVRRLYELTKNIPGGSIQSVGLNDANGQNLLQNYRTPRGESALIPAEGLGDYSAIQRFIQRLMSSNLIVRENADIVLLNGTARSGLASREQDKLESKNLKIIRINDADNEAYTTTQIIDLSGGKKPATLKALKATYTGATVTTTNPFGTKYEASFIVVLGSDRLTTNSTSQ